MFHKLQTLTLLMAVLFTANSHAESIAELQAAIKASETKIGSINAEQSNLQNALAEINQQIEAIASQPSPEKAAYQKAQQDLQASESIYNADGSSESKAKMTNAQFKMALAERKYKKSNKALADLIEQQSQLQTRLTSNQKSQNSLNQQIKKQNEQIVELKNQQTERNKAQQAARKNQELEAQRAEVARLKAALVASEKEKASLVANQKAAKSAAAIVGATAVSTATASTSSVTASKAVPTPSVPTPSIPTAKTTAAKPVSKQPAAKQQTAEVKKSSASSDNKKSAIYLDSKQAVQAIEQRLSIILATPDKNKTAYDRMLNIKPADKNSNIKTRAQQLDSLGHSQYKGEGKLLAGDTIFAVGFYRWRQVISNKGSDQYTFLLDIADSKNPKLYYYLSSLRN